MVAPTLMTSGSLAGEPIVLVAPASPELTTTVTPAATAASSASRTTSSEVSGKLLLPNDSLITLAPLSTAYWMAWRKPEVVVSSLWANTLSAITSAPGATPTILIQQPAAGMRAACPGATWSARLYSSLPWAAIELASRNASPPSVGAAVPSPEKSS